MTTFDLSASEATVTQDLLGGASLTLSGVSLHVADKHLWTPREGALVQIEEGARVVIRGTFVDGFMPFRVQPEAAS